MSVVSSQRSPFKEHLVLMSAGAILRELYPRNCCVAMRPESESVSLQAAIELIGVLRLRWKFAKRTVHSA